MDSFVFHAVLVVGRASLPIPAHFVRIDSFIRPELTWLILLRLIDWLIFIQTARGRLIWRLSRLKIVKT